MGQERVQRERSGGTREDGGTDMETSMRLGVGISMRQKGEGAPFGMPQQQPPKIANPAYLPAAAG